MTAMSSIAEATISAATGMPRFEDGSINLQEVLRRLAESVVNEVMSAEADQLCEATGNSRNGYRERTLTTCEGLRQTIDWYVANEAWWRPAKEATEARYRAQGL